MATTPATREFQIACNFVFEFATVHGLASPTRSRRITALNAVPSGHIHEVDPDLIVPDPDRRVKKNRFDIE